MIELTIEKLASFCKRRGIIFPNSEIYGSFSGFWDYGPIGVELKRNIENELWKEFVHKREDVVGIDGSIITHPKVWEASGHTKSFTDPLVQCKKCGLRIRADHLVESALGISVDGLSIEKINEILKEHNLVCTKCKGPLESARTFNLMFKTYVGPTEGESSISYLRPETAQLIFVDFRNIQRTARMKLPFGIAQMGKVFRNEISPRNFIFRSREFNQFEIEFFIHPKKMNECEDFDSVKNIEVLVLTRKEQKLNGSHKKMTFEECINKKIFGNKWHAYWIAKFYIWLYKMGIDRNKLRIRQHLEEELAHYAEDTWDIEYKFQFGWKEIIGIANRRDFDLKQHMKISGEDLSYFDDKTNEKVIPYVIEPSVGIDRLVLAFLSDAYYEDNDRVVLKLSPKLSPYKVAVFPLVNKDRLPEKAMEVYNMIKDEFYSVFDIKGSIGKRYYRQDEIGTFLCITIDYQTLEDNTVTVRDRDTTEQERIKIEELKKYLKRKLS